MQRRSLGVTATLAARRATVLLALLSVLGFEAGAARAELLDAPSSRAAGYSPYEQTTIEQVTATLHTTVDPDPSGKRVEAIDVAPLEVIEPRDPAPQLLNYFHATTRAHVIARELLLHVGEPYNPVLCDETARNLRQLPQLSLVICTTTRGSAPDRVRVLVIAKDVWSLRLGWELSFVGRGLESLTIEPSETNLGGTHQLVYGRYTYLPLSQSIAFGYRIPRLTGLRLSLAAEAGITWNRDGHPEGSSGTLSIARPLFSTQTRWAWAVGSTWSDAIVRLYSNAKQATYPASPAPGQATIPWEYHSRRFAEAAYATRSFGWATKNDFTLGFEVNVRQYRPPSVPAAEQPIALAFAAQRMPRGDTRVGPFAQYRGYTSSYLRVLDFETLGLQEDYRLGHDVVIRAYPVSTAFGSSRSFFGVYAGAQYTFALGDGLARAAIESVTEAQLHDVADAQLSAALRIVTPRLGFGRLVFDASGLHRYQNFLNRTSYLGGEGRLRGYPSNYFFGKDIIAYNLEFRSRPLELLSVQVGAAAFIDVGHAADSLRDLHPRKSAGMGVRMVFPQLNRVVFRADVGFPLADRLDPGVSPWSATVAFEQAFTLPGVGSRYAAVGGAPIGWLGQ